MKKITLTLLALTIAIGAFSQNRKKDERLVEETINKMMKAYTELPRTKAPETFLAFFLPDYKVHRVRMDIDGTFEIKDDDISGVNKLANMFIQTRGMEVDYKITKFNDVHVNGNGAYATFIADFTVRRDDEVTIVGHETSTFYLQRMDSVTWKVRAANVTLVRDNVTKYVCNCHIFKSTTDEETFVATTDVPNGETYSKRLDAFTFDVLPTGTRMIEVGVNKFFWEGDGTVVESPNIPGAQGKRVGKAKTQAEAVTLILKEVLYTTHCSSVKLK